ncbi:MAG: hypothetical protein FJY65_08105 [Calditrichaeota bacterium]|nr:hypothetical protein [Calditrichota bacterium]
MNIANEYQDQGLTLVLAIDTMQMYALTEVSRSAYLWDAQGLKHLYRISASGDSTAFEPPRIVLPARLESGKIAKSAHRWTVYSTMNEARFAADVHQQQKLLPVQDLNIGGKSYSNCVGVETIWTDTHSDGSSQTRRKIVWYAKNKGPVKVVSNIPPTSPKTDGEAVGVLVE